MSVNPAVTSVMRRYWRNYKKGVKTSFYAILGINCVSPLILESGLPNMDVMAMIVGVSLIKSCLWAPIFPMFWTYALFRPYSQFIPLGGFGTFIHQQIE